MFWSSKGLILLVDGVTDAGFDAGVLSVKFTIKSCIPDVESGLETVGQVVVLSIDSIKVAAIGVESDVVVKPGVFCVLEGMFVNVVASTGDDA